MDSFPQVTDLNAFSDDQKRDKEMIDQVMARFARADIGGPHSFHEDPSRMLSEQEIEKMRAKRETLEKHLNSFK
jgi:stress response protein YsnF